MSRATMAPVAAVSIDPDPTAPMRLLARSPDFDPAEVGHDAKIPVHEPIGDSARVSRSVLRRVVDARPGGGVGVRVQPPLWRDRAWNHLLSGTSRETDRTAGGGAGRCQPPTTRISLGKR